MSEITYGSIRIGDKVSFKQKGRLVAGEITNVDHNSFVLKLSTDYKGKNDDWYSGEKKHFFIKNCKSLKVC